MRGQIEPVRRMSDGRLLGFAYPIGQRVEEPGFTLSASDVDAALGRGVMREREQRFWNWCPPCKQHIGGHGKTYCHGSAIPCGRCTRVYRVEVNDRGAKLVEVVDPDEPSVGDVDGYSERGR